MMVPVNKREVLNALLSFVLSPATGRDGGEGRVRGIGSSWLNEFGRNF
jgi:hypothetical protein